MAAAVVIVRISGFLVYLFCWFEKFTLFRCASLRWRKLFGGSA